MQPGGDEIALVGFDDRQMNRNHCYKLGKELSWGKGGSQWPLVGQQDPCSECHGGGGAKARGMVHWNLDFNVGKVLLAE